MNRSLIKTGYGDIVPNTYCGRGIAVATGVMVGGGVGYGGVCDCCNSGGVEGVRYVKLMVC